MPRIARAAVTGFAYHIYNRGNDKRRLFGNTVDYRLFLRLLRLAPSAGDIRLLAYCLMPNHWHLAVIPPDVPALSAYLRWVTGMHARLWRRDHGGGVRGHVYESRYKSVPIITDHHLLVVLRYVEANPVRAGLVKSARDWPWSSRTLHKCPEAPEQAPWPWPVPKNWDQHVDGVQPAEQLRAVRSALTRGAAMTFQPSTTPIEGSGPSGGGRR